MDGRGLDKFASNGISLVFIYIDGRFLYDSDWKLMLKSIV